jgi:hypothetical protein
MSGITSLLALMRNSGKQAKGRQRKMNWWEKTIL